MIDDHTLPIAKENHVIGMPHDLIEFIEFILGIVDKLFNGSPE
jgi:hypothetical protein